MECVWRPQRGRLKQVMHLKLDCHSRYYQTGRHTLPGPLPRCWFLSSFPLFFFWFPPIWKLRVNMRKVISNPNQHSVQRTRSDVSAHHQIGPPGLLWRKVLASAERASDFLCLRCPAARRRQRMGQLSGNKYIAACVVCVRVTTELPPFPFPSTSCSRAALFSLTTNPTELLCPVFKTSGFA